MRTIQIDTPSIRWPNRCACCLGSAESTDRLIARRAQRDGAIWEVPYCVRCLRHHESYGRQVDAESVRREWESSYPHRGLIAVGWVGLIAAVWGVGVAASGGKAEGWVCLSVFVACGSAAAYALSWWRADAIGRNAARERLESGHTAKLMNKGCKARGLAVQHQGCRNLVHEFRFANDEYADMFVSENRAARAV